MTVTHGGLLFMPPKRAKSLIFCGAARRSLDRRLATVHELGRRRVDEIGLFASSNRRRPPVDPEYPRADAAVEQSSGAQTSRHDQAHRR
ncbi:hypothetical protein ACQP2Y_12690 [Actinoplanes sp. CA-051413]|uniref:hypothetical protein n=1 Tax=Actinoplanes sp. CA-051413 TaxID=3239899 RepID=UPI003D9587BB